MAPTATSTKQYVWIVRYGLTEFPLVEDVGPFDSDIDPTVGIEHANAIAGRIAKHVATEEEVPTDIAVYTSPFLRTVHTAHIIATAVKASSGVKIEEGLTEWQVPSLLVEKSNDNKITIPKSPKEHSQRFGDLIDLNYQSVNPMKPFSLSQQESEEQLYQRCQTTLTKILQQNSKNSNNIVIVSHAPCDIVMALSLQNYTLQQASSNKSKYPPWPLGGLTLFSRNTAQDKVEWKMEMYGDSSHMPGQYKEGIKRWTLPSSSSS